MLSPGIKKHMPVSAQVRLHTYERDEHTKPAAWNILHIPHIIISSRFVATRAYAKWTLKLRRTIETQGFLQP